jgi:hypothetical protein
MMSDDSRDDKLLDHGASKTLFAPLRTGGRSRLANSIPIEIAFGRATYRQSLVKKLSHFSESFTNGESRLAQKVRVVARRSERTF